MEECFKRVTKKMGLVVISMLVTMYEIALDNGTIIGAMLVLSSIFIFFWALFLYFPQK